MSSVKSVGESDFGILSDGLIAFLINLPINDITLEESGLSCNLPPCLLLTLSRNSYLPLHILPLLSALFGLDIGNPVENAPKDPGNKTHVKLQNAWLSWDILIDEVVSPLEDFALTAVPWHMPIGVLADFYVGTKCQGPHTDFPSLKPIQCTLHLTNFPVKHVVPFQNLKGFELYFRHGLKSSVICLWGKVTPLVQHRSTFLSEIDAAIRSGDGNKIYSLHNSIRSNATGEGSNILRYPVWIHSVPACTNNPYKKGIQSTYTGVPIKEPNTNPSDFDISETDESLAWGLERYGNIAWCDVEYVLVLGLLLPPNVSWYFVVEQLVSVDMACHIVVHRKKRNIET